MESVCCDIVGDIVSESAYDSFIDEAVWNNLDVDSYCCSNDGNALAESNSSSRNVDHHLSVVFNHTLDISSSDFRSQVTLVL